MHKPVMLNETLALLEVTAGDVIVDGTVGYGGHAEAMLEASSPGGILLGIDRDPEALAYARQRLRRFGSRGILRQGDHGTLGEIASAAGIDRADRVLLDLGVSSAQLDNPSRGFSFRAAGPLDMRMGPGVGPDAASLLDGMHDEQELAGILRRYGQERRAGAVARAILREQRRAPIRDTLRLAEVVAEVVGRRGGKHPATRTFQALRIAVNRELEEEASALEQGLALLKPGGRMAVIGFHSLEDGIAKRFFRSHAGRKESLQEGGSRWRGRLPRVEILTGRPLRPSEAECRDNPRARSARLRAARRLPEQEGG